MTTILLPAQLDLGLRQSDDVQVGEVIDLSIGDPADPTPQEFKDDLVALLADPRVDHYPDAIGDPVLLDSATTYYKRRFGITLDPASDVCVTAGALPALSLALRATHAARPVCGYAEPSYFGIPHAIDAAGFVPVAIPLGVLDDEPRLHGAFAQFAGGCFILNSPHNPTGRVLMAETLRKIAVAARAHDVSVVSDAVYIELFGSEKPRSFLEFDSTAVEVWSFSKTFRMCGWRCGFVTGKGAWIGALRDLRENADNGVPLAIQIAAASLLTDMTGVDEFRAEINERRAFLAGRLASIGFGVPSPIDNLGTNFLWTRIPPSFGSSTNAAVLLSSVGVKVLSGSKFGAAGEGFLRFSLNRSVPVLAEAARRIESVVP